MNAICLVIDRLQMGYLGAYGNTWIHTPTFDRLAAEGFAFDQAWIDGPSLDQVGGSCWRGQHPLESPAGPWTAHLVRGLGIPTILMTDEPAVARLASVAGFSEVLELEAPTVGSLAPEVEDTHLARCFAWLIERLESLRGPFWLWCHLRGLGGPWDAPIGFRRAYADADDPAPPDTAEPPDRTLHDNFDPDELLGLSQAYAGQVTLLDTCLAALLEYLAESPLQRDTLLAVASARGFPLGEHRRVGPCDEALYAELTHVPLVLRLPGGEGAAGRSGATVRLADLAPTLASWFGHGDAMASSARNLLPLVRGDVESLRDRHVIVGRDHQRALVTPAWYLRAAGQAELFVRRDDFWQANDVAGRCAEIVELARQTLDAWETALASGRTGDLPPLDERLVAEPS
jgi:arylsulfatase A-like enzyme